MESVLLLRAKSAVLGLVPTCRSHLPELAALAALLGGAAMNGAGEP